MRVSLLCCKPLPFARPTQCVFLCDRRGQHGGTQVDALAGSMSRSMQSVSMGSSEGFDMADRALHLASKQG